MAQPDRLEGAPDAAVGVDGVERQLQPAAVSQRVAASKAAAENLNSHLDSSVRSNIQSLNELTFENYIHTEHNHTVGRCADYTVRSAVRECGGIVKVTATRLARDETGRTPRRETTERRKSPKIAP